MLQTQTTTIGKIKKIHQFLIGPCFTLTFPDWNLTDLSSARCLHTGRTEHLSRFYFSFLCSIMFMGWEALKYMGHSLSKQLQESIASIPETVPTVRLVKRCQTIDLANCHDSVHLSSYSVTLAYV